MARDQIRDFDVTERLAHQARILGSPGVSGKSRVGAWGRGGGAVGSTPAILPGGTRIEHITLGAEEGQTIAAGGGTVQWTTVAAAPTEVRGFASALAEIGDNGSVGAIPIPVTGVMNWGFLGKWADGDHLGSGKVTVTLYRDGEARGGPVVFDLPTRTRYVGGGDDNWEVRAGDELEIVLDNDTAAGNVLEEMRFVGKIIVLATATTPPESDPVPVPSSWDTVFSSSSPNFEIPNVEVGDLVLVLAHQSDGDGVTHVSPPDDSWTEHLIPGNPYRVTQVFWKVATASEVGTMSGWTVDSSTGTGAGKQFGGIRVPGATRVVQHETDSVSTTSMPITISGVGSKSLILGMSAHYFSPGEPSYSGTDVETIAFTTAGRYRNCFGFVNARPSEVTVTTSSGTANFIEGIVLELAP